MVAAGVYVAIPTAYKQADRSTILSKVDKRISSVNVNHVINDHVTFTTDFIYAQTQVNYQLNPQPVTLGTTTLISGDDTMG